MNAPAIYGYQVGPPGVVTPRADTDAGLKFGRSRICRVCLRRRSETTDQTATELENLSREGRDAQPVTAPTDVWLNRLAAAAAPNPLSMLTTVTPVAQLFNMDSSAAMPPKLAP